MNMPVLPPTQVVPLVRVWLSGEPHGKGRPRSRIARSSAGDQFIAVYTDARTRAYERALGYAANAAMRKAGLKEPLDAPLKARMTAVFGVPPSWPLKRQGDALAGLVRPTGKPDGDNLLKCVDAFNGIIWRDDSLLVDAVVRKFYGDKPGLLVEVWEWIPPRLL